MADPDGVTISRSRSESDGRWAKKVLKRTWYEGEGRPRTQEETGKDVEGPGEDRQEKARREQAEGTQQAGIGRLLNPKDGEILGIVLFHLPAFLLVFRLSFLGRLLQVFLDPCQHLLACLLVPCGSCTYLFLARAKLVLNVSNTGAGTPNIPESSLFMEVVVRIIPRRPTATSQWYGGQAKTAATKISGRRGGGGQWIRP